MTTTISVKEMKRRLGVRDKDVIRERGILRSVWGEIMGSVIDVVKMAGGGLV